MSNVSPQEVQLYRQKNCRPIKMGPVKFVILHDDKSETTHQISSAKSLGHLLKKLDGDLLVSVETEDGPRTISVHDFRMPINGHRYKVYKIPSAF